MADVHPRARVDEVDWSGILPWINLFRSFRMAIGPGKLLLGMAVVLLALPAWWLGEHDHRRLMIIYLVAALVPWAFLGGAISRMAALDATQGHSGTITSAVQFTWRKYPWYIITLLFPAIIAVLLGLALAVGGLVLFNLPGLDIIGGILFFMALFCGMLIVFILILTVAGGQLLYPALSVEGTDTFDAVVRGFGYVLNRPWQWLFYTVVMMLYGAITFLFLAVVVCLTLGVTRWCAGRWVKAAKFNAMVPGPGDVNLAALRDWSVPGLVEKLAAYVYPIELSNLGFTGKVATVLVVIWVGLLLALLLAYAVTYWFSSGTWVYLLLRRSMDGVEFDEVYVPDEPEPAAPASPSDTAEPAPATAQATSPSDTEPPDTKAPANGAHPPDAGKPDDADTPTGSSG